MKYKNKYSQTVIIQIRRTIASSEYATKRDIRITCGMMDVQVIGYMRV